MIDAAVRSSFDSLIDFITSLGKSPKDLNHILLTHADLDHVGAAPDLQETCGATIYASQIEADALAEGHSSRQIRMGILTPLFSWLERRGGAMQVEVDEVLNEGDLLPVLGGLEVIPSPGHTPGHVSFYAPRHGLLFAGDSVSTRSDEVLYNQVKLFNWNQDLMKKSVHKQAEMRPQIVCSGHGPVVFNAADKFPG